jgi:hypothetical protein
VGHIEDWDDGERIERCANDTEGGGSVEENTKLMPVAGETV